MDVRLLLESTLSGLGYELVDFEMTPRGGLRVFIDKPAGVSIEDCAWVSNYLTRIFLVENVDYERLEVSSPGLDRPLKKVADFLRFQGKFVKIKVLMPIERKKKIAGRLVGIEAGTVRVNVDGCIVMIPFSNIEKARLDPNF